MIALFSSVQCCVSFPFISLKSNGYSYIYDSKERSAATIIYTLLSFKAITITPSSTYQMLRPLTFLDKLDHLHLVAPPCKHTFAV